MARFKEFFEFRLDLARTPKRIDLLKWEKAFWEKDFDKGEVFEGVYALDGDTLKVCLGGVKENGEIDNRPTALVSQKGSEAILVTLKRKTKADEKQGRTSSEAITPKTEAKREQISSGTMPKAEEELRDVKFGQRPEDYNTIFDNVLDVVDDYFEVAYANRWEGRIETSPVFERPYISPRSGAGPRTVTAQPVRWRAAVLIAWADDGGYVVDLRIDKEAETKTTKIDEKSPPPPASHAEISEKNLSPRPEMKWARVGRDTELEQVILRRLVEHERKRRLEQPRTQKEREERAEREMSGRGHPNTILLRDFHVDAVDSNRTISVTSLGCPATKIYYLPVAPDAKINVKGGNAFRNLKVGMRLVLELRVENKQMIVTEIRQAGIPPE